MGSNGCPRPGLLIGKEFPNTLLLVLLISLFFYPFSFRVELGNGQGTHSPSRGLESGNQDSRDCCYRPFPYPGRGPVHSPLLPPFLFGGKGTGERNHAYLAGAREWNQGPHHYCSSSDELGYPSWGTETWSALLSYSLLFLPPFLLGVVRRGKGYARLQGFTWQGPILFFLICYPSRGVLAPTGLGYFSCLL